MKFSKDYNLNIKLNISIKFNLSNLNILDIPTIQLLRYVVIKIFSYIFND